jgi:fructose/tagatose bisphosphate aldolase
MDAMQAPTPLSSTEDLQQRLQGILESEPGGAVRVVDATALREGAIDDLVYTAMFAPSEAVRAAALAAIRQSAGELGIRSASIQGLYDAMGRGEVTGFTVPALNLRSLTYDCARTAFRAASRCGVGALIFELARSEMGYTEMGPQEYAAGIQAAAIREGFEGPLFLQGDHFQVDAGRYRKDPDAEIKALSDLTAEAIEHDFLNIDVDSSTLVDLSQPTVIEQQRPNFQVAAQFIRLIRDLEPQGVTISIGAEIGEVGGRNSTPDEFRAFMTGLAEDLGGDDIRGPSKMSVQTGSSHGGVALPDGSIADVTIAFDTLEELSRLAREEYGMAGAVQHGASTLPPELFHRFPEVGTAEIHLATGFQNLIYDSPHFPADLRREIYRYVREEHRDKWKPDQTEAQFLYSNRKRALGPFKRAMWDLPEDVRGALREELEAQFLFLFEQLRATDTQAGVSRYVA